MNTPTDRQHYREMVSRVAAKAKAILPQAVNGRVESAVKLVLAGDVMPQEDGSVQVGSSDPTRYYVLHGTSCTCTDYTQGKAPEGWCKHRIAAGINKRVEEMRPAPPAPVEATVGALPEAPASVNVRVLVGGHEVQWTLRDTDEGRLAERLQALLKRPDIRPVPKPASRSQRWQKG